MSYADVRGERPTYGPDELARFPNDHAMCAGRWVPGADGWLVPQGMTVEDGTAYVASFDGTQVGGQRLCTMQSVDLRSGEIIESRYPVRGRIGPRQPTECRHGGGVVADEHGVWLAETQRLWLLDPDTLEVERGWALAEPVRGSFAVWGKDGELGLGRFRAENPARLWWFDTDRLLDSSSYELSQADAIGEVKVPPDTQGAIWAELGGVGPGLWFARSQHDVRRARRSGREEPVVPARRGGDGAHRARPAVGGQRVGVAALPGEGAADDAHAGPLRHLRPRVVGGAGLQPLTPVRVAGPGRRRRGAPRRRRRRRAG